MRFAVLVLVLAGSSVAAATEIHRCVLENGTVAFQETPCPEPATSAKNSSEAVESDIRTSPAGDDVFDFVNPFDEPEPPMPAETPELVSQDRAECEKLTRDAIDAIDLEMQENDYTKEQGQEYLAELLTLTRQLRECKQL